MDSESAIKVLSEVLKKFSKKDILDTISQINTKIGSMYTISTKDFSQFSVLLKDYNSSIKQASDACRRIERFAASEVQMQVTQLRVNYAEKKECLAELIEMAHTAADVFLIVLSLMSRIVVPFNNLRQNVITTQYLLASLRLSLSCDPLQSDSTIFKSIENLESFISDYRRNIDISHSHIESIADSVTKLKQDADMMYLVNNIHTDNYISSASRELHDFNLDDYYNPDLFTSIKRHIKVSISNIDGVITNLQYHDIISQKIEHIKKAQTAIVNYINDINEGSSTAENVEAQLKMLSCLPEILNVQVAQLMYINKDYQDSIDKITSMLLSISNEIKLVAANYSKLQECSDKMSGQMWNELNSRHISYNGLVQKNITCIKNVLSRFGELSDQYNESKLGMLDVFKNTKELRAQIENIEQLLIDKHSMGNNDIIKRMRTILADIKCNSNLMTTCFNKVTEQLQMLSDVRRRINNLYYTTPESALMKNIRHDVMSIGSEAKMSNEKCSQLSDNIAEAVKNVEYYNYFKKTVDEIIEMLNKLNDSSIFAALKGNIDKSDSDLLKYIKSLYTMRSEREIFGIVLNQSDNDNNIDDDEIEFF